MKNESKDKRFVRVVEKRVQNVLDSIRKLSQCSNPRLYEWSDEQLNQIWEAIDREIERCKDSYRHKQPDVFKL